jgi:hypothetical protein
MHASSATNVSAPRAALARRLRPPPVHEVSRCGHHNKDQRRSEDLADQTADRRRTAGVGVICEFETTPADDLKHQSQGTHENPDIGALPKAPLLAAQWFTTIRDVLGMRAYVDL